MQKPNVPLSNHTESTRKKTYHSVGPGDSAWLFFSVAIAVYLKGQVQRTKARAEEIWRDRDREPESGRN